MKPLIFDELTINVNEGTDKVVISWLGQSSHMDPANRLSPFFKELLPRLTGKEVEINFTKLNMMNSSTVPPILSLIQNLNSLALKTTIKYKHSLSWQEASFLPLSVIFQESKNITFLKE